MTNKLIKILFLLIFVLGVYIFVSKYDVIKESISSMFNTLTEKVEIPNEISEYNRDYDFETFKHTDNFKPTSKEDLIRILYTILDNGWNEFTFYCPEEYENCSSDIVSISKKENIVSLMNNYVHPYNSYINFNTMISGNKEVYVKIDKLYEQEDIDKLNTKLEKIKKDLKITLPITKDDIKKIHDYIIKNTTYDKNFVKGNYFSDSYKATGALITGNSVCSGYADAMAIILDIYNIPNFKVSSEEHIWNAVYVDNKWLHIDATWDDDENNTYNRSNFFLIDTNKLYELDTSEHTFNKEVYLELNK